MNVLITSASRKVWLVKAFRCALSSAGGGKVIAVDSSPLSAALYLADHFELVPAGVENDFLAAIDDICRRHSVGLVIPTRDEELPVFAERAAEFRKLQIEIMVGSQETISLCQDKRRFLEVLSKHRFAAPETYAPEDVRKIEKFPVFLKERFGKASRSVARAGRKAELHDLLRRFQDPIVQEFIDAPEFTVDLFADATGNVISVVPRERLQVNGGESYVARTQKNWKIIEESVRLAQVLSMVGHNTIQCFFHDGQVKFIEVNPRYGGGAALGFAAGANTPSYAVRLAAGGQVKPAIGEFQDGLTMLRYTEDLYLPPIK